MTKKEHFMTVPVPSIAVADLIDEAEKEGCTYVDSLYAGEQKTKVVAMNSGPSMRFFNVIFRRRIIAGQTNDPLPSFTLGKNRISCIKATYD